MPVNDTLLIGVDGGATEVKAHAVDCDNLQQPSAFRLRAEAAVPRDRSLKFRGLALNLGQL